MFSQSFTEFFYRILSELNEFQTILKEPYNIHRFLIYHVNVYSEFALTRIHKFYLPFKEKFFVVCISYLIYAYLPVIDCFSPAGEASNCLQQIQHSATPQKIRKEIHPQI